MIFYIWKVMYEQSKKPLVFEATKDGSGPVSFSVWVQAGLAGWRDLAYPVALRKWCKMTCLPEPLLPSDAGP